MGLISVGLPETDSYHEYNFDLFIEVEIIRTDPDFHFS